MEVKLKKYFPMIRERKELLAEIEENEALREMFAGWERGAAGGIFGYLHGCAGIKVFAGQFFKEILNPEYVPERFNDFLSCLLEEKVRVLKVLAGDSVRIADEASLLITDIVVELEDGRYQ